MSISLSQLIVWLIIGAIAGYIAGLVIRGRRQFLVVNIAVGLIGALIGGVIFNALKINPDLGQLVFTGRDFVAALVGAVILLIVLRALRPRFL